jgi:hypothetical protein
MCAIQHIRTVWESAAVVLPQCLHCLPYPRQRHPLRALCLSRRGLHQRQLRHGVLHRHPQLQALLPGQLNRTRNQRRALPQALRVLYALMLTPLQPGTFSWEVWCSVAFNVCFEQTLGSRTHASQLGPPIQIALSTEMFELVLLCTGRRVVVHGHHWYTERRPSRLSTVLSSKICCPSLHLTMFIFNSEHFSFVYPAFLFDATRFLRWNRPGLPFPNTTGHLPSVAIAMLANCILIADHSGCPAWPCLIGFYHCDGRDSSCGPPKSMSTFRISTPFVTEHEYLGWPNQSFVASLQDSWSHLTKRLLFHRSRHNTQQLELWRPLFADMSNECYYLHAA